MGDESGGLGFTGAPTDVVSSVRCEVHGSHAHVDVWSRGGKAGTLVVGEADARDVVDRLRGVAGAAALWRVSEGGEKMQTEVSRVHDEVEAIAKTRANALPRFNLTKTEERAEDRPVRAPASWWNGVADAVSKVGPLTERVRVLEEQVKSLQLAAPKGIGHALKVVPFPERFRQLAKRLMRRNGGPSLDGYNLAPGLFAAADLLEGEAGPLVHIDVRARDRNKNLTDIDRVSLSEYFRAMGSA